MIQWTSVVKTSIVVLAFALIVQSQSLADYLDLDSCDQALQLQYIAESQQLKLNNSSLCVEWNGVEDTQQSPNTYTAQCDPAQARQKWVLNETSPIISISAAGNASKCVNVQGYSTTLYSEVWTCTCGSGCHDNCVWNWLASDDGGSSGVLINPASSLCLARRGNRPVKPTTCASSSVAANLRFCDKSLDHVERAAALTSILTLDEKLQLWSPSFPTPYVPRINLKSYMWDATCIHGPAPYHLSPTPNVTVTAHAINLGATFDLKLMAAISNMTAIEMRALTQFYYNNITYGTGVLALGCDGGPLANSAHDPRWGRISETYGEDPYHLSRMGSVATQYMQQSVAAGDDIFLATSQTTRHFLGYHQSNLMPIPRMNITQRDLYDQYLPGYEALQAPGLSWTGDAGGRAEAIMCSYAAVNGVPSCASRDLLQKHLRDEWGSDALVQSDCCDSIESIWNMHHYAPSLRDAVAMAVNAGTQLQFGIDNTQGRQAFADAIAAGSLTVSQLDASVSRILLTRFRLGEFDDEGPFGSVAADNWVPFLDSPPHRHLARVSASDSLVLLHNSGPVLPLALSVASVAVVGPFANALDEFLHSYNGHPSQIVNPLMAIQELFSGSPTAVHYEQGTGVLANVSSSSIEAACAIAKAAAVTVAVLGLGNDVEQEGLDRGEGKGSIVGLGLPQVQQELLSALRQATGTLVLVIVSGGGVSLAADSADAVLWAGYGGEEAGHGLVDVLWGKVAPSGRLPQTVYQPDYLSQVGPILDYSMTSGVGRTYRYLTVPPLFYFGYGLSYTTFTYSNLTLQAMDVPNVWVQVSVTNTGKVVAATVTQVYVSVPAVAGLPTPRLSLQGFDKTLLAPGETQQLAFRLVPRQFQTVQADGSAVTTAGQYTVSVGGHQPGDALGDQCSNVLQATLALPL